MADVGDIVRAIVSNGKLKILIFVNWRTHPRGIIRAARRGTSVSNVQGSAFGARRGTTHRAIAGTSGRNWTLLTTGLSDTSLRSHGAIALCPGLSRT